MNRQNPVPEMIEEYAHLQHQSEIYQAHGERPPANMTLRMNALLAWGRANIHPNSFPLVIKEVNARVANLHMQRSGLEQKQNAGTNKQLLDNAVGKLTKGMLGQDKMTGNQLAAIVNKQPLRARLSLKRHSQAEIDAQIRAVTKQFDPRGVGFGEKEYVRVMDTLTDAADKNPAEFARLCFKFNNIDPAATRRECNQWKAKRVEFGLKRRQRERDEVRGKTDNPILNKGDRAVPDHEHRKATLVTATLADSIDRDESGGSLRSDIHESYLNDTGRRGDLARAFEKVESIGYDR